MIIKFLDVAKQELDEAITYYETESPGLGNDFLNEALNALDRVGKHPDAWHQCSARTRRCLLRRFPYGVIYVHSENEILVVAVACLHRRPEYWLERINKQK